jgi:UDP-N-acetylmuramoyl-tripeptide--D-alanyl-D-alanine ligase
LLIVDDVIEALQRLANRVIEEWRQPVVGITGSAGKTTTKDLTAHVLAANGRRPLKSRGNLNTELGVPLSILEMVSGGAGPEQYDVAVLEMAMSRPKEIARLCQIAPPDIAVELLVAPVHLEFFGTVENIAAAKAELVEGLKPGGTAVLNADDALVSKMRLKHSGRTVTFGIESNADVRATDIEANHLGRIRFRLETPSGGANVVLPLLGRHNVMNSLAAATVAMCFGIEAEGIADALAQATPSTMRGVLLEFADGFTVIDDSYNSNPRALLSIVRTLADDRTRRGRRVVIAGEMLELGADSGAIHREVGRDIAKAGIDVLWGVRGFGLDLIEGAREAGLGAQSTRFFENSEAAAEALVGEVRAGDAILIKGSRGVQTDKIVTRLREKFTLRD